MIAAVGAYLAEDRPARPAIYNGNRSFEAADPAPEQLPRSVIREKWNRDRKTAASCDMGPRMHRVRAARL
jgi:hypothetical protein